MKKYLSDLEENCSSKSQLMNHEWARFESFKTFPRKCMASPLLLAKCGFYYSGNGEEAICFCCGLKVEKWTEEEPVATTHKRLSPKCDLLNGELTRNIPIHETNIPKLRNENAASREARDIERGNDDSRRTYSTHQYGAQSYQIAETNSTTENRNNDTFTNKVSGYSHLKRPSGFPTEQTERFPGIFNERPKYSDYALKTERLSSFSCWPLSDVESPDDLAVAGFFYTCIQSTKDNVKCFFCGGQLRDWTLGDDPWIEHARWYHRCAFVTHCKGKEFVNLCHTAATDSLPHNGTLQLHGSSWNQTNVVQDQSIIDLNSVASKLVLDMGYTQDLVEKAIKHTREHFTTSKELKAQDLLDYLLDTCYSDNSPDPKNPDLSNHSQSQTSNGSRSDGEKNLNSETKKHDSAQEKEKGKDDRKYLKEENRQLKEQIMCKICMDKDANIVFLPCGHMVSCVDCAHALRKCAVCRSVIQGTVRTYPA